MFVVLQIEGKAQRGRAGILDRLRKNRLSGETRQTAGGVYQVMRWYGRTAPDWELIESACRRAYSRVLTPGWVHVPEGVRILAPALPRFEQRVLRDTACEIAARSGLPLYRRVLGLVDPGGELADMLPALLRFYSCVKVVTGNLELYTEESERMMHELGAPVLVGCDAQSLDDCMLILTRKSEHLQKSPCTPVLCPKGYPGGNPCITLPQITPPREIIEDCPPGIPLQSFAGALFEFCGVQNMNFAATAMLCDYRQSSLAEVANRIRDSDF